MSKLHNALRGAEAGMKRSEWFTSGAVREQATKPELILEPERKELIHGKLFFESAAVQIKAPGKGQDGFFNNPSEGQFAVFDGNGNKGNEFVNSLIQIVTEKFNELKLKLDSEEVSKKAEVIKFFLKNFIS